MEILKFDIKIPFWCSFKEFGTVSSNLTYSFPPPPTLFGMILNSMGKLALHCIDNKKVKKELENEYIRAFENLEFAIAVRDMGEKIDDYSNILKRSRENEFKEKNLNKRIDEYLENFFNKEQKKNLKKQNNIKISKLNKLSSYLNNELEDSLTIFDDDSLETTKEKNHIKTELIEIISIFWSKNFYQSAKFWQRTQIVRQRIIKTQYTIFLISTNDDEYSIQNIYRHLKNPLRPLYCGESDDIADVKIYPVCKLPNATESNQIVSVIPRICSNSQIVNIPIVLRNQRIDQPRKICSIPNGQIDEFIECYNIEGENIVFL